MAENQNIPIDQRYVPKSYLRNFSKIIGEGKKEKNMCAFFNFPGSFIKRTYLLKVFATNIIFMVKIGFLKNHYLYKRVNGQKS
jgi:hypothetical protein